MPVRAGGTGTETEGGYGALAVNLSGDYSQDRVATVSRPAPVCWWEPWPAAVDPDDAEAVKTYWVEELRPHLTGHAAAGQLEVASEAEFDRAIEADEQGQGVTWYRLAVNEAVVPSPNDHEARVQALVDAGCTTANERTYNGHPVAITLRWFPFRQPPPPRVDVLVLAQYAYEVMNLVAPAIDWNPKITSRDNASLVNLPTWMWVENPQAVQNRTVTASAGGVSATVTARTGGLSITSPAGSVECEPGPARRAYEPGRDEEEACTIAFSRASYGYPRGFPLEARTDWEAAWTSSVGREGTLAPRTVSETTYVPVAQSQALVIGVD